MLSKKTGITYNSNNGNIMFDEKIVLMDGENVGVLQLKGELDTTVKAILKVKPPQQQEDIIIVTGSIVPYKSISREFSLPNKGEGEYKCQLVLQLGTSINKSEIFTYNVLPSL